MATINKEWPTVGKTVYQGSGMVSAVAEEHRLGAGNPSFRGNLFVPEGQRWGHVDVYAWNDGDRPGKPAGGEAQGLRAAWAMLAARFART